jgi:hypothetical protein
MCMLARKRKQTCEVRKKVREVERKARNKNKEMNENEVPPIHDAIHHRLISAPRGLECVKTQRCRSHQSPCLQPLPALGYNRTSSDDSLPG